jgi:hypothetical protein
MNVGRIHVDEKNEEFSHRKLGNLNTGPYGQCNYYGARKEYRKHSSREGRQHGPAERMCKREKIGKAR